ncbi:MAG TPA: diguanylate cyclase [Solirubrobacterales bacterium]|nr:diguanylate cyclase [Solirubrobacterales bacterium]
MAKLSPRNRLLLRCGGAALVLGFLAFALHAAIGFGGDAAETFFGIWDYDALMLGAAASCLARAAIVRRERLAWSLLGAGLLAWTAGEIYYSAAFAGAESVPIPSLADAGYLAFYPLAYAALIVLMRERIGSFPATRWLDGLIVGSAVAALAAALALGPIVDASSSDSTAAVATNLAYPIADLTLLTLVVTAASFTGWRPGAGWLTLGGGLIVLGVSDGLYLWQSAQGTYVEGGILDAAWPLGALLLATAAWIPPGPKKRVVQARGLRVAFVPAAAALIAIGVQSAERYTVIPSIAAGLSLLTMLGVVVRLAISFRDTQASLESSVREALTDSLTGLPNRRKLMEDLELGAPGLAVTGNLRLLVMFDLDGFKAYNDSYGHPAGDALLARLGHRLAAFAAPHGSAYRLGGDEFCLLAECTAGAVDSLVAGGTAALSERGEGFLITASQGSVLLPSEARTRESALQLADRRMYANKNRERSSAGSQSRDVLLTALRERQPDLHAHLVDVAALARPVAEELGVSAEQRDEIFRAAELHDVGKMAIPDAILNKPGPLDPPELEFMRKHTMIGERIIASAPALVPVARIVRSSHERWDGSGYPDRLEGEQIPLGSRIVAVCDAYQAMVSERPYSVAMLPARALDELARGAGSQFDPKVVAAFERVLAARAAAVPGARA